MNIVVTGGAGFIGTNLVLELLKDRKVTHISVIDSFYASSKSLKELLNIFSSVRVTVHICDIRKLNSLVDIFTDIHSRYGRIDEVYNLACPASPPRYQKDPIYTLETSVIGISNLIKIQDIYGFKLLQASTSEVYGNPLHSPQEEQYFGNVNPIGLRSCYDEGKRAAETYIVDYKRMHPDARLKIIRIFNTYGPYMDEDDGRVISNFICQALKGDSLTMYGDGTQTRSFQYIDDLIRGMLGMMRDTDDDFTGPVNIGNPGEFTLNSLAEMIISKTSAESSVEYMDIPSDDPLQRKPDITQAKERLSWQPRIQLSEGLDRTIAYFRKKLEDKR